MEKFRKFADDATGNHPFLPHPKHEATLVEKLHAYLIGVPHTIGRLALFILVTLIFHILDAIFSLLPLSQEKNIFQKLNNMTFLRLMLVFTGTYNIKFEQGEGVELNEKSLVLCNHSSSLDPMILKLLFNKGYMKVERNKKSSASGGNHSLIKAKTTKLMFSNGYSVRRAVDSSSEGYTPILDYIKDNTQGPIFALFEGGRTNNHAVMNPTNELLKDIGIASKKHKINLLCLNIKYNQISYFSPTNTYGNLFLKHFSLMMNFTNNATVYLDKIPASSLNLMSSLQPAIKKCFTQHGETYMTKRGPQDYKRFLEYVAEVDGKKYYKDE